MVAFGVWCFWVTFLRWDKGEGFKTSVILIATIYQILLVWPNYRTVIDGFNFPSVSFSPAVRESLTEMLESPVDEALRLGPGRHMIEILSEGPMYGRMADITVYNSTAGEGMTAGMASMDYQIYIEGGMWIVRAMWTASGIQNAFANYQSWMIFTAWLIGVLAVIFLVPPFRTIRGALWRMMIPAALNEAANSLRLFSARLETSQECVNTGVQSGTSSSSDDDKVPLDPANANADAKEERQKSRTKLDVFICKLFEGNLAKLTVYEPRLLAFKPPECTMEILLHLCTMTSRCLRIALGIDVLTNEHDEFKFLHQNREQYVQMAGIIEQCAKALAAGDASLIDKLEAMDDEEDRNNATIKSAAYPYDPFELKTYVSNVAALTRKWLHAMAPSTVKTPDLLSSDSFIGFLKNIRPWIFGQVSHVVYVLKILIACSRPSAWKLFLKMDRYQLQKIIWSIKYTIGFITLLLMEGYWPAYQRNFAVFVDDQIRGTYAFQNGGWAIASYCFATTQTTEGSVKKGILRMTGTIVGSFSAWLALTVCEDDRYDKLYNVPGLVAWMTITSIFATYVSTERGFSARISLSNDYAFGPIYFLIAQIIIVCNTIYFSGPQGRDAMVVNRLFSNLVGIFMSMILAVIPPGNFGGDPGHCKALIRHHRNSSIEAIRLLLSSNEDECTEKAEDLLKLRERTIKKAAQMQELVGDFEKDAVRLNRFRLFQVDPQLSAIISKVTRDVHIAAYVPQVSARILSKAGENGSEQVLGKNSRGREELQRVLSELEHGGCPGNDRVSLNVESDVGLTDIEIDLELLLRTLCFLATEMKLEEEKLNAIKWGCI